MLNLSPTYFAIAGAFTVGVALHLLRQLDTFVDNRKNVLRNFLTDTINEEPYYLVLVQNIGKDCKTTEYFREIICGISPAYGMIIDEIRTLRRRYARIWWVGLIIFILIGVLSIIAFLKPEQFDSLKFLSSLLQKFVLLKTVKYVLLSGLLLFIGLLYLIVYLYFQARLWATSISSKDQLEFALDRVLSHAYKGSFKDRATIITEGGDKAERFKERYEAVVLVIDEYVSNHPKLDQIHILDIGCGDGQLELLFNDNYNVLGIDLSEKSIQKAREYSNGKNKNNRHFDLIDALEHEFNQSSFDIIILIEVLEHFLCPVTHLSRFYKWLKSDGVLIATLPSTNSEYNRKVAIDNRPKKKCKNIMGLSKGSEHYIDHLWFDQTTKTFFPHRLYSRVAACDTFKKVFDSVSVTPIIGKRTTGVTCDSYIIVAQK